MNSYDKNRKCVQKAKTQHAEDYTYSSSTKQWFSDAIVAQREKR